MEICAKRLVTRFELFSLGNYIFRATFDFYFLERSLVYCQKKTISTLNVYSEFYQRKCELAGVRKWPELPKYTLTHFSEIPLNIDFVQSQHEVFLLLFNFVLKVTMSVKPQSRGASRANSSPGIELTSMSLNLKIVQVYNNVFS